jgi:tRNA-dihydrouridine synthase 3
MTRCAQLLEETTHIDFIDVNLGCPIELIYQQVGETIFNIRSGPPALGFGEGLTAPHHK